AERIVGAAAVVERLPDGGDVARIAADQERRDLLADQRDQRRIVAEVADGDLRLAEAGEPVARLDLDEARVERVVPAEVADMGAVGGDRGGEPGRANGGDLHGPPPRPGGRADSTAAGLSAGSRRR